jgi:hypothetical protein
MTARSVFGASLVPYGATSRALARLTPKSGLVALWCLAAGGVSPACAATSAAMSYPAPAVSVGSPPGAPRAAVAASPPPAAEPLDLATLAKRLRKTKALDLRTTLAVKNESDDLLQRFRAYHAKAGPTTLAELRRSYDALVFKLRSLLEDADPRLARDIDRSRAAIWAMLTDPDGFETSALAAAPSVEAY